MCIQPFLFISDPQKKHEAWLNFVLVGKGKYNVVCLTKNMKKGWEGRTVSTSVTLHVEANQVNPFWLTKTLKKLNNFISHHKETTRIYSWYQYQSVLLSIQ